MLTERDKIEIAEIVTAALKSCGNGCALGIKPETAHELISFADTWKTCRRALLVGAITVAVGSLLAALWAGIRTMLVSK